MSISPGTWLGPYEVIEPIGKGGMGEVYQATDTKLDREVALKILPEDFAADPDRLARFQREAKVLASLNHPNIAAIYGLEDSTDTHALVLELVEGPTLQDRISQGAIALDEALPIAKQIAEALEAAHEQGIIHRDLKPANIKVTPDGVVKVLDFGLAKAMEPERSEEDIANSPTMSMTAAATRAGFILGTAAYMSPEQARGETVGRRSDIWAFGVVLLEMLTGKPTFPGKTVSDTLAAVLRQDPDWNDLPSRTPRSVRRLLRRCLEKESKQRLGYIGDARLEIDDARDGPERDATEAGTVVPPAVWQRPMPLLIAAILLTMLSGLAVWNLTPSPDAARVVRTSIVLPEGHRLPGSRRDFALSPDGTHLVYSASGQLHLLPLDEESARPIPGTEGARFPMFSPDSQRIGFLQGREFQTVRVTGGAPVSHMEVESLGFFPAWASNDALVLISVDGASIVSTSGGSPQPVASWAERLIVPQQLLPDGETVLAVEMPAGGGVSTMAQVVTESLAGGDPRVLVENATSARYLPTGHLVFWRAGSLMAVPFDLERLAVTGNPVSVVAGVGVGEFINQAWFDVSDGGTLAYAGASRGVARTLAWVDRHGQETPLAAPARAYASAAISPDGTRVALDIRDQDRDLWIWDVAREMLTRFTFDPAEEDYAVWTPDGARIIFSSMRTESGASNLYWKSADGTGTAVRLTESPNEQYPTAMSPDGASVAIMAFGPSILGQDIGLLALADSTTVESLVATEFWELNGAIAPDGRWIAYESNVSGQYEVYVRPFPNVNDGLWQISNAVGHKPKWRPDGRELFFVTGDPQRLTMMRVAVQLDPTFTASAPEVLFEGPYPHTAAGPTYDVAPDGQRFLMIKEDTTDAAARDEIHVVLNWFEELKARVPTGQ